MSLAGTVISDIQIGKRKAYIGTVKNKFQTLAELLSVFDARLKNDIPFGLVLLLL